MKRILRICRRIKCNIVVFVLITGLFTGIFTPNYSQQENRKENNQEKSESVSDSDSLNKTSELSTKQIKISINPFLNRSLLNSKLLYWNYYNYSEPLESQLFFPEENNNDYRPSLYSLADYHNSKYEFRNSMKQMLSFKSDTDLGVVGKILGYTGFAATIGLAFIHLNKYKEFYKKEEKEE